MDNEDLPKWMHRIKAWSDRVQPRIVRQIAVAVIGITVLLIGIVMIVLPGPSILVIPAGLAILALEFRWARRWLKKAQALSEEYNFEKMSGHARDWRKKWQEGLTRLRGKWSGKSAAAPPPATTPAPAGDAWKHREEELISAASGGQKSPP